MRKLIKLLIILVIICICLFTGFSSLSISNISSSDGFSVKNAINDLNYIAKAPHPTGTEEHKAVKDYIVTRLQQLGASPEIQQVYFGAIQNIVGRIKGTDANSKAVMLSAHYDSTHGGPGASDDGVGVASLLETLRVLNEGPKLKNDIIILITDDEENGMLGAAGFVQEHPFLKDVGAEINFEARGNRGPYVMFETAEDNSWYIDQYKKSAVLPVAYSFSYDVYRFMDNDTDFTIFKKAGLKGLNFATVLGFETYHMKTDNVQNLSMDSIQHAGSNALAMAKQFGNMDLSKPHNKGNSVYFTAARSVLIVYPESLVIALCAAALVLLAAVIFLGIKRSVLTPKGLIIGFLISFIPILASTLFGFIIQKVFDSIYGNDFSDEGVLRFLKAGDVWIIILVPIVAVLTFITFKLFSKKFSYFNLLTGSLIIWSLLCIVSSLLLKSSSYLFTLPLIITLIGMLIALVTKSSSKEWSSGLIFLLAAAAVIIIFTPTIALLYICMTFETAMIISVACSIPMLIIIPAACMFAASQPDKVKVIKDQDIKA